jgi:foldase protein PrsA
MATKEAKDSDKKVEEKKDPKDTNVEKSDLPEKEEKKTKAESSESKEDKKKKFKFPATGKAIILGIIALILVFLATFGILIYGYKNESSVVRSVGKVIPFPAATADGKFVLLRDYYKQLEVLKNYYVNFKKVDFSSEDGKKQLTEIQKEVSDRLLEDAIISVEAKNMDVKLTKEDLDNSYNELVKSNGGIKAFTEILSKFYGLTPDEFKEIIYRPRVLREKLADKINSEETTTGAAKKKADEIYARAKAGEDFAKLAQENSQDPGTAANGGDLGFFGKGKMVPEFEEAAFKLNVGEISEPVRTVYGYHIIKVTDKKGEEIRASHILIKVSDFNDWIANKKEELKTKKILVVIPGYATFYKIK